VLPDRFLHQGIGSAVRVEHDERARSARGDRRERDRSDDTAQEGLLLLDERDVDAPPERVRRPADVAARPHGRLESVAEGGPQPPFGLGEGPALLAGGEVIGGLRLLPRRELPVEVRVERAHQLGAVHPGARFGRVAGHGVRD